MTAPRNRRGPKGVEGLKRELSELKSEIATLRPQIKKRECDFENRQAMLFNEKVRVLEIELEENNLALAKCRGAVRRHREASDAASAALVKQRLDFEGELRDAANAAKKETNMVVAAKMRMIAHRDLKLEQAKEALEAEKRTHEQAMEESALEKQSLEELCTERLSTIKRLSGKLGGRPQVRRAEEELAQCDTSTAWRCQDSMARSVAAAIGTVGEDTEVTTKALMDAIFEGGYLEAVWESELMWGERMAWLGDVSDDLRLFWSAQLSMNIRDKLTISYDKMDEMRFMFSHHRVGKQLVPRPWVINPHSGARVNFPQPIRARCGVMGWAKLVSAAQTRYGLSMDKQGKVAQRGYAKTVGLQLVRDEARGLLRPISESDPLICVLGADGTGVGKRSMMHVANSISPSYRAGISVENEKNIATIATSITDDHWSGLNETLCGSYYTGEGDALPPHSIAADVNSLIASKQLISEGLDGMPRSVPVRVRGCFDLVAARGIRGGRGRCACHVEADTSDRFDVPNITDDTDWEQASNLLEKFPFLLASVMRSDSHTPPESWDFEADGPWRCEREGCDVKFSSRDDFIAQRKAFLVAKADKSDAGKKLTAARAKLYAQLHTSQQGEFEPPCTDLSMADILIDPLHCLMLNLPKVVWKYTFGDRMTNAQRELVAEYLTSIGCPLDVRAKGDGRDCNRKWFSGEVFQRFVEGDAHSPGLAENIMAIMDIIYLKAPAPAQEAASNGQVSQPTANKTARNGGGGAKKRRGGFSVNATSSDAASAAAAANTNAADAANTNAADAANTNAASASDAPALGVSAADDDETLAKLRARYQSHMDIVKLGLDAWKHIGLLYAEWRTPWVTKTIEYASSRALALLKCAIPLSLAMKACSIGKHKSWYSFLLVWVVPRQMAMHGDTWAYGTSPVEQRGARLKKFVRNVVCWRPAHDGWVAPIGPEQSDGTAPARVFIKRRKYESCAMMQVLRMCVAQEEMWAAPAIEGARSGSGEHCLSVSERRMQTVGRTTLLKFERGKGLKLPALMEEVIDLT